MRKGLTLTLLTVAIALISVQARAMAPIIQDIPSPIVGNIEPVTGAAAFGNFVYNDAIDLNKMATDDVTPSSDLLWTYTGSLANGASNYLINGVAPINSVTTDPTSPTTAMIINRTNLDPVPNTDGLKNTITIRNKALSPIGAAGTDPGATASIITAQTQAVTFFCSDGNAYSSTTLFFYSENKGADRLSGGDPFKVVKSDKITTPWAKNTSEWIMTGSGQTAPSKWAGTNSGVCLIASLAGSNYGSAITSFPYFSIADNQVYRIKMTMLCSQTTGANTPFWDIVLENYETHTGLGQNLYIMDTYVYGNEGYANALISTPSTFTWYWTPPAVATDQWRGRNTYLGGGAFTSARDLVNDPRLRFRLMDVDGVGKGQDKSGSVCLQEIEIAAIDITRASVKLGGSRVNITTLVDHGLTGGNVEYIPIAAGMSTGVFSGGTLTLTPSASAQGLELAEVRPATDATFSNDPAAAASTDNYPIAWKSDEILRLQVGLSAPTANDELHPYDAIVLLFNTMTDEINTESYQTARDGIGAPKQGAAQTYTLFFNTGQETKSTAAGTNYHRLRWLVRAVNSPAANFPLTTDTLNTGSVKIHSIKVDSVEFQ